MRKYTFILIFIVFLAVPEAWADKTYQVVPPSEVGYYVEHKIGFSTGQFLQFDGEVVLSDDAEKLKSLQVTIETNSLSTYVKEREDGLKSENFLNTAQYPQIVISSKKIKKDKLTANVTALGQTRPVDFQYVIYGVETVDGVSYAKLGLQGAIDRRDFGIIYNVASQKSGEDMLGTEFQVTIRLIAKLK